MIQYPEKIEIMLAAILPGKPPHREDEGDRATMAGKSTFPRHEDFFKTLPACKVIIRLIEQTMAESGTDDGSDQKSEEKRIKKGRRNSLSLEEPLEYIPSESES